ncbi:hypothetical protein SAMN00808754_1944 [Thermanaeromonas toyohensis ToBE]|uniref:Putative DnaT-like domain-containing protein n=1 Tax=Thermanaeromonas toyohensis ToBE TaxID=698762 RepID=A0A1W1VWZ9_9FIRM|nr:DnaT-like ssDNA-binding protein [Thermanaeromonas toyohensis]SMB97783.1 hypothetical protein SAMN00808754_1944 [Thermanaeromonas toyohensis ToBE]
MALQVGVNSYVTVSEADAYFTERIYADEWQAANTPTKEKALIQACKRINRLAFKGVKADEAQLLAFPRIMPVFNRVGVIGFTEGAMVPQEVKDAQCEEALALLKYGNSARTKAQEQNVVRVNFGEVSEEYRASLKLLSKEALELLKPYLAGVVSIK